MQLSDKRGKKQYFPFIMPFILLYILKSLPLNCSFKRAFQIKGLAGHPALWGIFIELKKVQVISDSIF